MCSLGWGFHWPSQGSNGRKRGQALTQQHLLHPSWTVMKVQHKWDRRWDKKKSGIFKNKHYFYYKPQILATNSAEMAGSLRCQTTATNLLRCTRKIASSPAFCSLLSFTAINSSDSDTCSDAFSSNKELMCSLPSSAGKPQLPGHDCLFTLLQETVL